MFGNFRNPPQCVPTPSQARTCILEGSAANKLFFFFRSWGLNARAPRPKYQIHQSAAAVHVHLEERRRRNIAIIRITWKKDSMMPTTMKISIIGPVWDLCRRTGSEVIEVYISVNKHMISELKRDTDEEFTSN